MHLHHPALARAATAGLIALASALGPLAPHGHGRDLAQAATTDTITVTAGTPARTMPSDFFGVNYVAFWDGAQGSAASAVALAQTPIKAVRFAGGSPADWYDWQDPYYSGWSSTSPSDLWRYAQKLGATPLFQTNIQGNLPNPPGQTYTVNSPQNAAAWATYDMTSGIPAAMEVGNEEDVHMTTSWDPTFQPYITAFNAQAQAMHAANPAVKVFGPASTNEWYWWGLGSLPMFLQQTGTISGTGQVDGVSLHYYTGSGWSDTYNVAQQWNAAGGPWTFIQSSITRYDARPLPVAITEWNLGDADSGTGFNQTLGHGLVVADLLGAFAQSGVAQEDYFAIHGGGQYGLLYGTGESRPVDSPTPTYYATALWGKMGRAVLPLTQAADPSTTVSAYATQKDDGSVQVLAINKTGASQPLQVGYQGFNPQGGTLRAYTLSGAAGALSDLDVSYDGVSNPSPQQPLPGPTLTQAIAGSSVSYTLPAYSIVVLDVAPGIASPTATATTATTAPSATATTAPSATATTAPSATATTAPSATATTAPSATAPPLPRTATISFVNAAASPSAVSAHHTVQLSAGLRSDAAINGATVTDTLVNASGAIVYTRSWTGQALPAGVTETYTSSWRIPGTLPTGPYAFRIRVTDASGALVYGADAAAGAFTAV